MRNLIDFHFHIDYYQDYKKKYEDINKNKIYTLCVTNMPEVYEAIRDIFEETKYVKFALGFNPQLAESNKFNKKIFEKYLDTTKYIGEVGLDYSNRYVHSKEKQIDIFECICLAVGDKNKILSVHSRNSEDDVLAILIKNNIKNAVFHWYTGKLTTLDKIIDEGYYFSINYEMLKSKKGLSIIKRIPLDRILVESDGPFTKIENKVCEPQNLHLTYEKLNETLSIDSRKIVSDNFKDLIYRTI